MTRRLVIIETPYAGRSKIRLVALVQRWLHRRYARFCMRDAILNHNEAPLASHLLYTQSGILRDGKADERAAGIKCGLLWGRHAEATIVYTDWGISEGMKMGIDRAAKEGRPITYRRLRY